MSGGMQNGKDTNVAFEVEEVCHVHLVIGMWSNIHFIGCESCGTHSGRGFLILRYFLKEHILNIWLIGCKLMVNICCF